MQQYKDLLQHIIAEGAVKTDRTGTGTKSVFGYQMRFDLAKGFPLLTTKKIHLKSIIHELLFFIKGETNIRYLLERGVGIWTEWPYAKYLKTPLDELSRHQPMGSWCSNQESMASLFGEAPADFKFKHFTIEEFAKRIIDDELFAQRFGDLGPVYGYQWRSWPDTTGIDRTESIDQLSDVLRQLKETPDSRRMIVTAWNPSDVPYMALPACHCLFQFYTAPLTLKERMQWYFTAHPTWVMEPEESFFDRHNVPKYRLSCQLYQRSSDVFLGVPFNIASYSLLTMMIAQECNMALGDFIWTSGDTHLYSNHMEQVAEQLSREPRPLPTMTLNPDVKSIFDFKYEDFTLTGYDPHPSIKAPVAV